MQTITGYRSYTSSSTTLRDTCIGATGSNRLIEFLYARKSWPLRLGPFLRSTPGDPTSFAALDRGLLGLSPFASGSKETAKGLSVWALRA